MINLHSTCVVSSLFYSSFVMCFFGGLCLRCMHLHGPFPHRENFGINYCILHTSPLLPLLKKWKQKCNGNINKLINVAFSKSFSAHCSCVRNIYHTVNIKCWIFIMQSVMEWTVYWHVEGNCRRSKVHTWDRLHVINYVIHPMISVAVCIPWWSNDDSYLVSSGIYIMTRVCRFLGICS